MKAKTLMIVDGMNCFYRSFYAYKRLSYKGDSVSVIYGMPAILSELIFRLRPHEVIVVWDGERSEMRKSLVPNYKGDRKTDRLIDWENLELQKRQVRKLLYALGIKQVLNPQAEADDMIYKLTRISLAGSIYGSVRIVSSDKDFNQLLVDDKVMIWNDSKKDYIHARNCKDYFGYTPEQTVDYLSLVGDDSDNIPGYRGIGPKKAADFLEEYQSIENFLSDKANKFPGIDRMTLRKLIKVNSIMINLEVFYEINKETLKTIFYKDSKPKFNYTEFKAICSKFGLVKFMQNDFTKHFKALG
jgi:DNA polymerase-1